MTNIMPIDYSFMGGRIPVKGGVFGGLIGLIHR
jgi:hypothetical protein